MSFRVHFDRALRISKGESSAIREAGADEDATLPSVVFLAISGIAAVPFWATPSWTYAFVALLGAWAAFATLLGCLHQAARLQGARTDFGSFFRAGACCTVNTWAGLIGFPAHLLFLVGAGYMLVCLRQAVQESYGLERGSANIATVVGLALFLGATSVLAPLALIALGALRL